MAARCYAQRKSYFWALLNIEDKAEAERLARRAAELGRDDAVALSTGGITLAFVCGDIEEGDALIDRALSLNPNLAWAWLFGGWAKLWKGEPEVAIEREARAMRLSPHDHLTFNMQSATAAGHFFAGRYPEALSWAESAVRENPNFILSRSLAAASSALVGNQAAAERALVRLRELIPKLGISNLKDLFPMRRLEDFDRLAEGMRQAGLPG
jgi:tetratricopeptide (TPR) repeat protein